MSQVFAILAVLAIIYLVPFAIYGGASAMGWIKAPSQVSPRTFLLGILVSKLGTATAFVLIIHITAPLWAGRWLLYAALWFFMFAVSELGDAIARRSPWREALLGVVSEAIYLPAAAYVAFRLLG